MIIADYLKKVALFKTITAEELQTIASTAEVVTFAENDLIIEEGGLAKALYVILIGSVQVFTQDKDGNEVVLARLDAGNYFGEQGYLNNLIRTASVKAIANVELIKVNYSVLDPIFKKSAALRKYLEKNSLERSIANLQSQLNCIDSYVKEIFTKKGLFSSAEEAVVKHYKKGEIIFNKGDEADFVYFISSGTIELIFAEPDSKIIINKNHMFGEVGVVQKKPRSATARALTNVSVIAVSDKNFLNAIKKASKLKSLVMAFSNVYTLPKNKAVVEQFIGKFQHSEAIFSKYKLQSGKVAVCAKVVDQPIFMMKINDVEPDNTLQFKRGDLIERTIQLKDRTIVGITAIGEWSEINILCEMLLDGIAIHGSYEELFAKSGSLLSLSSNSSYLKEDIICNCMVVSYQKIKEKIDQGCSDFNKLSFETGACTACGSCRPKILDILGQAAWTSAKIHLSHQFNAEVDAFVIESLYSKFHPFFAGQYVLVKLQIDNMWLERAYTLVSPSNESQQYEIIIKKYSEGAFSRWLFQHANETLFIWVSQPNGQFTLKPSQKPILCFAGGVGITPFIAFLRDLQKGNTNNKFYIFYSVTHLEDAVIPDDVKDYLKTTKDVTMEIWDTATKGRMDGAVIEKTVKNIDPEFIYICGGEGFEKVILDQLQAMKFNSSNVLTEKFVPAG